MCFSNIGRQKNYNLFNQKNLKTKQKKNSSNLTSKIKF